MFVNYNTSCPQCGVSYSAFLQLCPNCSSQNKVYFNNTEIPKDSWRCTECSHTNSDDRLKCFICNRYK